MISKILLQNFRNFKEKLLKFYPQTTVIVGPNASGKTNILEGLFLLSTGKSFRAKVEEEMISYEADISRIKGQISAGGNYTDLEVVLTRGAIDIGTERLEKVARKKLLVSGISKRLVDFAGNFRVTLFAPHDLDLVTESPSLRRNFLDIVLSQVDREYRRASLSYEKGLRQRNRLLYRIREEGLSRSQLLFWNKLLIKNGDYISGKREEFINFVNASQQLPSIDFCLEYDRSAISEGRLEQYVNEEIAAATTLVGPHRDDMVFKTRNSLRPRSGRAKFKIDKDLSRFGSRGEQRMGVLWLKLSELAFIEKRTSEKPTLLLDDIFSELDHEHREIVMEVVKSGQVIITTADPHFVEKFDKSNIIELD